MIWLLTRRPSKRSKDCLTKNAVRKLQVLDIQGQTSSKVKKKPTNKKKKLNSTPSNP